MTVVVPPQDTRAYVAELEAGRQQREQWFRTQPDSPVPASQRTAWEGLDYYPVDPDFRFEGPLIRKTTANTFSMAATGGELRTAHEIGYFLLDLPNGSFPLPVYEMEETPGDLFLPFLDATTGVETYYAGRYLNVEEIGRGLYRLDFNLAFNPFCAYGGAYSCPIAPENSRLPIAVRAGEKGLGPAHSTD
jgi:uncharacterized protein (DUF1684 family)